MLTVNGIGITAVSREYYWLVFYVPPLDGGPTSGPYVTIPLIRSGTPTMVFENYRYQPFNETLIQAHDFVQVVDNLNF